jgi:hypothetical protein
MSAEYKIFEKIKKNENAKIWRYMDLAEFLSLLVNKSLYFKRSDKFEDPFEGSSPKLNVEFVGRSDFLKKIRKYVAISCWHINENESAAMWKLYTKGNSGIAVQSTYKRLVDSFSVCNEKPEVGVVQYIDFQKDFSVIPNQSEYLNGRIPFYQFMYKRKSFIHEQELRALIFKPSINAEGEFDFSEDLIYHGIPVEVEIQTLIEKIFICPDPDPDPDHNAASWLTKLIKSIAKKCGVDDSEIPIKRSSLADDPIY